MICPRKDYFIIFSTNKFSHLQFCQIIKEFKVVIDFVNGCSFLARPGTNARRDSHHAKILKSVRYGQHLRADPNVDFIPVLRLNN
ncbi:MAG: hypothetical protein C0490_26695 [Marivirga sp.]|nr:hypothetical protein [Marivirga sp.]